MARRPERWRHVSNKGNNMYAPQNMLIEGLGTRNRKIVCGRAGEELGRTLRRVLEARKLAEGMTNEMEMWLDGTISGDGVDSQQVEAVRLAANSQQMCNTARSRAHGLPVLPCIL